MFLEKSIKGLLSIFKKQKYDENVIYSENKLNSLEKIIDYKFKNCELLKAAITHSSHLRENHKSSSVTASERMEFFGDSILGMVVAEFLFIHNSTKAEGTLSKLKAKIVSEKYLFLIAKKLNFGEYIILSNEESDNGGREKPSILSDLLESLICAIYLDSGLEAAKKFIITFFLKDYKNLITYDLLVNYKSKLQEFTQSKFQEPPTYSTTNVEGPDHLKIFTVEVWIQGKLFGTGSGKNKKSAQQMAAKEACLAIKLC